MVVVGGGNSGGLSCLKAGWLWDVGRIVMRGTVDMDNDNDVVVMLVNSDWTRGGGGEGVKFSSNHHVLSRRRLNPVRTKIERPYDSQSYNSGFSLSNSI